MAPYRHAAAEVLEAEIVEVRGLVRADGLDDRPPARLAGDPTWSSAAGAIGGGVATAMFLYAGMFLGLRPVEKLQAEWAAALVTAGVVLGAGFGRTTRRLMRLFARVAFGAIEAVSLWLVLYVFVLLRFAPASTAAIPFGLTAAAALLYGACVGAVPPMRIRYEHGRRF
jgi:hypothetical protein